MAPFHAACQTREPPDSPPRLSVAAAHPARVPLSAALEAAWQRAVAAVEAEGQHRRAQADLAAARRPWAAPPALEATHRDDRLQSDLGRRETEVALAWPLWLPGQRAATSAAADAGVELASHAQAVARLRVAGDLRESAFGLAMAQAESEQAHAAVHGLLRLVEDVERRVRAGDMARADAMAARGELLSAQAAEAELQLRVETARNRWRLLTGLDGLPDVSPTARLRASDAALESHPEVLHASRAADVARKRLALVEASNREPPELLVGVRQDADGRAMPSHHSMTVGVRVPFGTDDRNRPLLAAARAEVAVAEATALRLRERLAADAASARVAAASAQRQLQTEQQRAALLRERAQLIETSFRAGETALPDLLRAVSAAAQADGAAARQQAALGLADARLQQALGQLP
jgi:cobalt-zinc-cadmium efflux system outer membrane protein